MKVTSWRLVAGLIATIVTSTAYGALIERDLISGSGDSNLTYDSTTGLEWLDVSLTAGRSFTDVANGWGGWIASGFRFATSAELRGLISDDGLTPNYNYNTSLAQGSPQDIALIKSLTIMLGVTFIYEDQGSPYQRRSTKGFVADNYSNSPGYENYGRYADIGYYELGWTTFGWANDGSNTQVYRNSGYGDIGSFLVRDAASAIPEPSTYSLLALGMALLGVSRWQRR